MTDTNKAILLATDSQLLEIYRNYDKYVGMSNQALMANANLIGSTPEEMERAAIAIQDYREKTYYQLIEEIRVRGLNVG